MTTIEISLPDQLAEQAAKAGLLLPESIERLLREQLKAAARISLQEAMERMSAVEEPGYMSPEQIAVEIKAMRAEKRAVELAR